MNTLKTPTAHITRIPRIIVVLLVSIVEHCCSKRCSNAVGVRSTIGVKYSPKKSVAPIVAPLGSLYLLLLYSYFSSTCAVSTMPRFVRAETWQSGVAYLPKGALPAFQPPQIP